MPDTPVKIFWSWQSDLPGNLSRNFIEAALKAAVREINDTNGTIIEVDRDTRGVGGMPNISETILAKIAACDVFVWDASIIGQVAQQTGQGRQTTNPNVTFELGFAVAALSWERVIGVMNTHFGRPDNLPFDLRHRRWPIDFCLSEGTSKEDKRETKSALVKTLKDSILAALAESPVSLLLPDEDWGTVLKWTPNP